MLGDAPGDLRPGRRYRIGVGGQDYVGSVVWTKHVDPTWEEVGLAVENPVGMLYLDYSSGKFLRARFVRGMAGTMDVAELPPRESDRAATPDWVEQPIVLSTLSVRLRRALGRLGVRTYGQLSRMSPGDLLSVKGFGRSSLDELRRHVRSVGFSLRDDYKAT